jgi:hypothetical protein
MLALTSYAFSRGVTHIFRGCFAPTGCYAFFPGVFRAAGVLYTFSGVISIRRGVTLLFPGCFTPPACFLPDSRVFCFPGVFRTDGVLRIFSGGVIRSRGVSRQRRPGRYLPADRYVPDFAGCSILVTPVEGVPCLYRPCYTTSKVS